MLLGVSLDRVSQSGRMLWQTAALCSGHRGVSRDWLCSMERSCYLGAAERSPRKGGRAGPGWERSTGARRERHLRLQTLHCTGMERGTRGSPATTETRGRLRGGRAGSRQRKPSGCQQFTWTGVSGLWHFVSQCNFTRTCVCVCVCFASV